MTCPTPVINLDNSVADKETPGKMDIVGENMVKVKGKCLTTRDNKEKLEYF